MSGVSTHLPVKVNTNIRLHILGAVAENLKIVHMFIRDFSWKQLRDRRNSDLVPSIRVIHDNEAIMGRYSLIFIIQEFYRILVKAWLKMFSG